MTGFAIVLLLVGLFLALEPIIRGEPPVPPREVVVAAEPADTYALVSTKVITRPAQEVPRYAWTDPAPGTIFISKGPLRDDQVLTYDNAAQVGSEWRPASMDYEILSFPAEFDKMVAGQIRSGHRINIYGYHREEDIEKPPVRLIAGNIWVVDARSARGTQAEEPTPTLTQQERAGDGSGDSALFGGAPAGSDATTASIVTIAADPDVIWRIVDALGAQSYQAWVTLASTQDPVTPTPVPTATPTPTSTPTPVTPTPTAARDGLEDEDGDRDVIHVVLLNWLLDLVDPLPEDLGMIPTTDDGYTFDYYGRELTLEIRNNKDEKLWAERWDQDKRARVLINGTESQRVWFEPGEGGVIQIELVEGAREATVVLMDADKEDRCFSATYVTDVTIPDGTQMEPRQVFTKTWRVRNNGTCTWPEDTKLAFFKGERMSTTASIDVTALRPGEEYEASVLLTAPAEPGQYTGKWRLQTGAKFFGGEFWVKVDVEDREEGSDAE